MTTQAEASQFKVLSVWSELTALNQGTVDFEEAAAEHASAPPRRELSPRRVPSVLRNPQVTHGLVKP
eukprot:6312383-Amphidinium_carterae.1